MRGSLIFILLLVFSSLYAQPELLSSVYSPIGTSTTYDVVDNYEEIDTTQQGSGITWNFSDLITSGPPRTFTFMNPSATPEGASFPSANYAVANTAMNYIDYYIKTGSYLDRVGYWIQDLGVYSYTDPQRQLVFPMTLGTVNYDTYEIDLSAGSYSIAGIGTGTLILPSGTYMNVVLVRSIRSELPAPIYSWYSTETGTRLLHFTMGDGLSIIAWALSDLSNAVNEHGMVNELSCVHPVIDVLEFRYSSEMNGVLDLSLTNTTGQIIHKSVINVAAGQQRSQLSVSDLASGVYLLTVRQRDTEDPGSTLRFVKQ